MPTAAIFNLPKHGSYHEKKALRPHGAGPVAANHAAITAGRINTENGSNIVVNSKRTFPAMIVVLLLSAPASVMEVNLMEMPAEGEINISSGFTLKSSTDVEITRIPKDRNAETEKGKANIETKGFMLSGMYGLSNSSGVFVGGSYSFDAEVDGDFGTGDVDNKTSFSVGGYSTVGLMDEFDTLVYGQYTLNQGKNIKSSSGIVVGLVGMSRQKSGMKLYAGPEYIISAEMESDYVKGKDEYGRTVERKLKAEPENSFGFRLGFSKKLKNKNLHLYGTATFMHRESFYIGVSTPL